MKTSKNIIFSLILLFLVMGMGGCASSGSSASTESSDTTAQTENELSTFSLPATIAKLDVETIDNTTLYFVPAEDSNEESIGTLYWYHRNRDCGRSALLASDTVIGVLDSEADNDCRSTIPIDSTLADTDLAIVNFGSDTTVDENGTIVGSVSLPTAVVIHSPLSGVTAYHTLTVMGTFMSNQTDLSTDIAKDVLEEEMGFLVAADGTENVAFVTQNADDSLSLSTIPVIGGTPTDLVDLSASPLSIKNTIAEAGSDILYLLDESYNMFRINVDGTSTSLEIPELLNESTARFWPHPNGDYFVYKAEANDGFVSLGIFDTTQDVDLGTIPFNNNGRNYTSMEADWLGTTNLAIISEGEDGKRRFQKADVSSFILNGSEVSLRTAFTQTARMHNPTADNGVNNYVFYVCNSVATNLNNLCRYDDDTGSAQVVASYAYNISSAAISADRSSLVVFELDSTPPYICIHDINTEENSCVTSGQNPVFSPNNDNIIAFQAMAAGTPQVGIYNIDNN